MESLIFFNCWMAEKIQSFCAWLEMKTKLKYELIERFIELGLILIFLIMLIKTKYYNVNYWAIEFFTGNFIIKIFFFIFILLSFLKIIFPMPKKLIVKKEQELAAKFPVWYQISSAFDGVITLIIAMISVIIFLSVGLSIRKLYSYQGSYLDLLILANMTIIRILNYNYYPTAHYK